MEEIIKKAIEENINKLVKEREQVSKELEKVSEQYRFMKEEDKPNEIMEYKTDIDKIDAEIKGLKNDRESVERIFSNKESSEKKVDEAEKNIKALLKEKKQLEHEMNSLKNTYTIADGKFNKPQELLEYERDTDKINNELNNISETLKAEKKNLKSANAEITKFMDKYVKNKKKEIEVENRTSKVKSELSQNETQKQENTEKVQNEMATPDKEIIKDDTQHEIEMPEEEITNDDTQTKIPYSLENGNREQSSSEKKNVKTEEKERVSKSDLQSDMVQAYMPEFIKEKIKAKKAVENREQESVEKKNVKPEEKSQSGIIDSLRENLNIDESRIRKNEPKQLKNFAIEIGRSGKITYGDKKYKINKKTIKDGVNASEHEIMDILKSLGIRASNDFGEMDLKGLIDINYIDPVIIYCVYEQLDIDIYNAKEIIERYIDNVKQASQGKKVKDETLKITYKMKSLSKVNMLNRFLLREVDHNEKIKTIIRAQNSNKLGLAEIDGKYKVGRLERFISVITRKKLQEPESEKQQEPINSSKKRRGKFSERMRGNKSQEEIDREQQEIVERVTAPSVIEQNGKEINIDENDETLHC